jgi:GrpB-like predicted nucleotidyltransferase (UPF0157 family)
MLGLEKGVVRLVSYTSAWKQLFKQEKAALQDRLAGSIIAIQHIGSTSIPGMPAKPIIDIAIAVAHFEQARVCIPMMEELGYQYKGEFGIPRRHYFVKGDPRLFHVHMSEIDSQEWHDTLLFRDYLRSHARLAREYAQLKVQLAAQYPHDREAYMEGKTAFVLRVLQLAKSKNS